jgi:hypothetical protein
MPKYLIEGKTIDGFPIREYFDAVSKERALGRIAAQIKYFLRNDN